MRKIKAEWMRKGGIYYCSECGWGLSEPQSGEPIYMVEGANGSNPERLQSWAGWQDWMMNYCPNCGANMRGESEENRLKTALLEFIEKEIKEPTTESSAAAVPEAARVLIELWKTFDC